jgi:ABC-2 type transport system ATP-binding protein
MLLLENVQKYYGGFLAMNIPTLFIEQGIWWIQGENGSGKTTFLKMIAGLHQFTGTILLNNKLNLSRQRQAFLKAVNYAEAEPLYPSFLTAKDLVNFYCNTKGGNPSQIEELLKHLHLFDAYTKPLGTYSSGMTKKLSLALAFAGQPILVLLDEPLTTIDKAAIETICTTIKEYLGKGVSFMVTSHQPVDNNMLSFTGKLIAKERTICYEGV